MPCGVQKYQAVIA